MIISFLLSFSLNATERVDKTGTTAAKFLSVGVGSRANGLGNAFVGIANDASAMYWNPSGISQIKQTELIVNYTNWYAGIDFSYIGLALPVGTYGVLGMNITNINMGEFDVTTEEFPEGTGEVFKAGSYAIGLAYAKGLTDRFMIGTNLKYIHENIMNCNANSFAVDLGTLFITPFRDIRFGVSISNFGKKLQMSGMDLLVQKDIDERIHGNNESVNANLATDKFDLPLLLRVGLSGDIFPNKESRITWAIDAAHPNDNTEYINLGVESALFREMLFLRAGMKSLFMETREDKLSLGFGLNFGLSDRTKVRFDYAYQSSEHLDQTHKFTLTLKL